MEEKSTQHGILVNTEYCTGCHSCEVACKKELNLAKGEFGIKLTEVGPFQYETGENAGTWEWTYAPIMTNACDMCVTRTEAGKLPACVHHCQAWCMYYGPVDELIKKMDGQTRWMLLTR
jgi:Fe-S-cluster-containing dehydrogenase component